MLYILMCKKFNIEYNKDDEKFKIWPLETNINMNGMIRDNHDVMQDFEITNFRKINDKKYYVKGISTAKSIIKISGSALVYAL